MEIEKRILKWFKTHSRELPWRTTKDPYFVWLSEVILQQTRVKQGIDYYQLFVKEFPDVCKLANATEDQVMKLWQGLGYYSRARNLHFTAKEICYERKGLFPKTASELQKLKGIGPYTASAIASISFNEVNPAIDGNVYRFLSRLFDIDVSIDSNSGKKIFFEISKDLISASNPGDYNQAMMEYGARICKPKKPLCEDCIFRINCISFQNGTILERPVRDLKKSLKERYFNFFIPIVKKNNKPYILIQKRKGKDVWKSLYQFPMFERDCLLSQEQLHNEINLLINKGNSSEMLFLDYFAEFSHKLTHQVLHCRFFAVEFNLNLNLAIADAILVSSQNIYNYAVPKPVEKALKLFLEREV
ncbi:MAG: A/G-specific adenine glycosylase [Bacteroidales bacterium]